ncbi:MAG: hypothetical protein IBX67_01855 [Dehalococcoidia bacterium]|nr:hypothetical protein [Dehalococcoidia bacterium]
MTRSGAKKPASGRQTVGKRDEARPLFRRLPWFAWLLIGLAIAGVVVAVRVYPIGPPPPDSSGKPRAAIVDQLHTSALPNEAFVANVTRELEEYGFEVDLYQGDEITVDFYRDLAKRGHRLILFRVHSGLVIENGEVLPRTLLFTNEEYSATKYAWEQTFDRLGKGSAGEGEPMMFGITADFITSRSMPGEFDDTVIIMMGCSALYYTDLAEAFVDRGASVYLGWHGSVVLNYVDEATPYLIEQLCSLNVTIKEAVDSTMEVVGLDPSFRAELRYHPPEQGDKTLQELLQTVYDGEAES